MALSLSSMALPKPKKKPVTLQTEEQAVAKPVALQQRAPSPPRETAPAATNAAATAATSGAGSNAIITQPVAVGPRYRGSARRPAQPVGIPALSPAAGGAAGLGGAGGAAAAGQQPAQLPQLITGPGPKLDLPSPEERDYVSEGGDADAAQRTPPTQYGNAEPPPDEPASNEELNAQIRSLMEDLISGRGMDVSTAEEEALIRELMQDRLGQGLVEQRARMGRAGFGASGALAAMEGDVRRQAGQQATQETLALRRQAEQEAIRNALQAVGVDIGVRGEARKAAFDEEFLNALKASLGMDTSEGEGGGGAGGIPGFSPSAVLDVANSTILNQGVETNTPSLAASGQGEPGMESNNPIVTQSAPSGSRLIQDSPNVGGKLYLGPDGLYYLVEA